MQAANSQLSSANAELQHRLELVTQRLELALSQGFAGGGSGLLQGLNGAATSLFMSPTTSAGSYSSSGYSQYTIAPNSLMRGSGGGQEQQGQAQGEGQEQQQEGVQGQGQVMHPDPTSPGMNMVPQGMLGVGGGAAGAGAGLDKALLNSSLMDPEVRAATEAALLAAAHLQRGTPSRSGGLLGFLFNKPSRPKKRVRNVML